MRLKILIVSAIALFIANLFMYEYVPVGEGAVIYKINRYTHQAYFTFPGDDYSWQEIKPYQKPKQQAKTLMDEFEASYKPKTAGEYDDLLAKVPKTNNQKPAGKKSVWDEYDHLYADSPQEEPQKNQFLADFEAQYKPQENKNK